MPKDSNDDDRVIMLVFTVFQAHSTEGDNFAHAKVALGTRLGLSDLKRLSFVGITPNINL